MSLDARITVRRGDFTLDVEISADAGEVLAVLGPNGSGKSTLLSALSGLLAIDAGRICVDGVVLDDPAADVFVPPEHRPIGVVFQDHVLFAHLNARENVAFGLRARGAGKAQAHSA
ncbi:MAG: ATP-binding cassette domain-containing protein, partial [Ilumatobacteraceae bacterium]